MNAIYDNPILSTECREYTEFSYDKSYIKNTPMSLLEIKSSNCAVAAKAVIYGGTVAAIKEFPHMVTLVLLLRVTIECEKEVNFRH